MLDIDDPWSFPSSVQHTYLVPRSPTVRIRQSEIWVRGKCEVSTLTRSGTQIVVGGAKRSEEGRENSPPQIFRFFSLYSPFSATPQYSNFWNRLLNNFYLSAPSIWVAIIVSYPTNACEIIVLLTTPTKYREFFPTLFEKTTDFQLIFKLSRRVQLPRLKTMVQRLIYHDG